MAMPFPFRERAFQDFGPEGAGEEALDSRVCELATVML